MNSKDFKTIVDNCIANINSVLANKSREYSSKDNKLHNFEQAQKIMRCNTKEYALWGMFAKHLVSITDMVEKYEKYGILPDENMVEEKIGDGTNYFVLLKACFLEDIYNAIEKKKNEKIQATKEFADKIKECPQAYKNFKEEIEKFEKTRNKELEILINEPTAKTATEIKEQAAIANSMYQNPRKRLVVEKLRKMLKPLFVYLTEDNRFVEYEHFQRRLNMAEMEHDHVPDEFVKDIVIAIEELAISREDCKKRDDYVTDLIQKLHLAVFNVNEEVWYIGAGINGKWILFGNMLISRISLIIKEKKVCYWNIFGEVIGENNCFKTKEEAQQECDKRNKSEKDVKDIFDTASDLATAMVVNKRKKAVVDNMQDKLKPIIEYLQIFEPKQYQYFSNLCFQEIQKHNSITDEVFYKTTIDFLNSLMLPDKDELPQYQFRTMKQIRDSIVKRLRDELEKM